VRATPQWLEIGEVGVEALFCESHTVKDSDVGL
jgi:hypothetical protein